MAQLPSFKKLAEIAVNSPKIAELTKCEIALKELAKFDASPRVVLGKSQLLSPFGHNATAQNGDIDFALCSGAVTLDQVIDKVHVYRKTRKCDPKSRPATAKRVMEHLRFLAGKPNGKNRLADRIARFMGKDKWDACIEMETKVYSLMRDVYPRMKEAYDRQYNPKTLKA